MDHILKVLLPHTTNMFTGYNIKNTLGFSIFLGRGLKGIKKINNNKINLLQNQYNNRFNLINDIIKIQNSKMMYSSLHKNKIYSNLNLNLKNKIDFKRFYSEFKNDDKINKINKLNKINKDEIITEKENKINSDDNKTIKESRKGFIIKLKYFLLRQNRPFNIDELTAFFSWILMGNFLWIFIGTTTFIGFLLYIVNWIGDGEIEKVLLKNLLTFDNKLNIDLNEPSFKANWEDGKIKIRNLKINSEYYKFKISELNLTFSFNKWFDGKGLINEIEIEGLKGDVNIFKDEDEEDILLLDESFNDKYEINHIKVKHSKINFNSEKYLSKPLELIIFNCDMNKLRREWIVYDFLNANTMFGSLGGSLFTLHKRQHRFAHFSGMDLHDQIDDFNNIQFNNNNHINNMNNNMNNSINRGINRNDEIRNNMKDDNNNNNNNNNKNYNKDMSANKINNENKINDNEMNNRKNNDDIYDDNKSNNNNNNISDDLWKKITRLRIDMLDLSFLNNKNSKLNWIESGKAEIIFDIMLPNEDDIDFNTTTNNNNNNNNNNSNNIGEKNFKFEFSIENMKNMIDNIYKKFNDEETPIEKMNKYVVIDMKIKFFNLTAKLPNELPISSLTGLPYITSKDLQSMITFINDEKFGLSSNNKNKFIVENKIIGIDDDINEIEFDDEEEDISDYKDNSERVIDGIEYGDLTIDGNNSNNNNKEDDMIDDNGNKLKVLPAIKFRIVQNLNDFEYIDLPSLLNFSNMKKPREDCNEKIMKSFINTNKFIDNCIVEVLSLLLIYKEEIQTKLIEMYSRRSGFEILFNNFILGNLILVGLGSFVI
ncbi:hypothetical protein C6P40_003960 [Pichia californica]|uniref:Mitochondrial distribution and morphology protein 31 n=1 Tax=Pichia californica TaxID=460514 RepID=A0A9P6WGV6_9ASCO|nr:hypothetical protein C6P40_003960 [[Candida] californica]